MMEQVTAQDFLLRFPMFGEVDTAVIDAHLKDAFDALDPASFSNTTTYRRAQMLWAAHFMTLAGYGKTSEANIVNNGMSLDGVQSVSDGSVSISFRQPEAGATGALTSTGFGRELSFLLRSAIRAVVGGGGHVPLHGTGYGA